MAFAIVFMNEELADYDIEMIHYKGGITMKQQKQVRELFIDELMDIDGGQSLNGLSNGDDEDINPMSTMAVGEEQN